MNTRRLSQSAAALLLGTGLGIVSGCASHPWHPSLAWHPSLPSPPWHRRTPPAAPPEPPPVVPERVGAVAVVNDELHFVLIDVGTLYTPPAGTALKSFSAGKQTAILAVNPERRRPFVVADIIEGNPQVGDDVVQ